MEQAPEAIRAALAIRHLHRRMAGNAGDDAGVIEERLRRVISAFGRAGSSWTLVGAHAVGILTQPRATEDFDFVIEASKLNRILEALEQEFGHLETEDVGAALRVRNLDLDLIRSSSHRLFQRALRQTREVGNVRIPIPEVLVILKFLAVVSPWRGQERRVRDLADIIELRERLGDELDGALMKSLSKTVYPGAEKEFAELLGKIDRGEPVAI